MIARRMRAAGLSLVLGACTTLAGGDPELYGRMSESDVTLAARLVQTALENAPDGATRSWSNDTTGNRGTITPVRTYLSGGGLYCREYREELVVEGESGRFRHTACRDTDARWRWI